MESLKTIIFNQLITQIDVFESLKYRIENHPEESGRGSTSHGPILDFCLLSEIFDTFDRIVHLVNCEEGGQVGGVRGDHYQGEKPPHTGHHSDGGCSKFERIK